MAWEKITCCGSPTRHDDQYVIVGWLDALAPFSLVPHALRPIAATSAKTTPARGTRLRSIPGMLITSVR